MTEMRTDDWESDSDYDDRLVRRSAESRLEPWQYRGMRCRECNRELRLFAFDCDVCETGPRCQECHPRHRQGCERPRQRRISDRPPLSPPRQPWNLGGRSSCRSSRSSSSTTLLPQPPTPGTTNRRGNTFRSGYNEPTNTAQWRNGQQSAPRSEETREEYLARLRRWANNFPIRLPPAGILFGLPVSSGNEGGYHEGPEFYEFRVGGGHGGGRPTRKHDPRPDWARPNQQSLLFVQQSVEE